MKQMRHRDAEMRYSGWTIPTRIKPIKLKPEPSLIQRLWEKYDDVIAFGATYIVLITALVVVMK
jgi:hypothetical protein